MLKCRKDRSKHCKDLKLPFPNCDVRLVGQVGMSGKYVRWAGHIGQVGKSEGYVRWEGEVGRRL